MKKVTDSIESAIANVQTAFPSIYSKEDVVSILESLRAVSVENPEPAASLTNKHFDKIMSVVLNAIDEAVDDLDNRECVDLDSAEFEINYNNTIELSSVDMDDSHICSEITSTVKSHLEEYFEELLEETEEVVETETPYAIEQ